MFLGTWLAMLLPGCGLRAGVVDVGSLPPPDGRQMAHDFFDRINSARQAIPLPPVPHDASLDQPAGKGLQIIQAGLPEGVSAIDHLEAVAHLPIGLDYAVGFEARTPGIDDRTRREGEQRGGAFISDPLLAADPALEGIGWAAAGPWSVVVLRARVLGTADAPSLQSALEGGVQRGRPNLRADPQLAAIAAEAVADGALDYRDQARYGRAGGVPVVVSHLKAGPHLATSILNAVLDDADAGTLSDAWLDRAGTGTKVSDSGTVIFVVLASGEADRAALATQLVVAEARAPELVNRSRAEAALPPVQPDAALMDAARQWVAEASRRGCYVSHDVELGCPGPEPRRADRWHVRQHTWYTADHAFVWYLAPAAEGDHELKRFGAAAALAADGTVWSILVFAA